MNLATYRRGAAAACLVLAGVLSAVFILFAAAPGWGADDVERLETIVAAGGSATVSLLAFAAYQLPLMVGLLGMAHVLRSRTPRLAELGAASAATGAFGYAVYAGSQLVIPAMAADEVHLELYAQLRADTEPLVQPFGALGMLGFVLGLLLISIALWRAGLGSRWVPVVVWAFIAVEFVGTSVTPLAGPMSAVLLLAALVSMSVLVLRSPAAAWTEGREVLRPAGAQVGGGVRPEA